MLVSRLKRMAGVLLLAGALSACAPVFAAQDTPSTPTTVTAPSPATQGPSAPVVSPALPDPERCMTGEPFHRITFALFVCVDTRYHPLFPLTIPQMVDYWGLPSYFKTVIIPRETGGTWDPTLVNHWNCVGLTQHCPDHGAKALLYAKYGYRYPQDAKNPWVHLRMTKVIFDARGLQPWECGACLRKHR